MGLTVPGGDIAIFCGGGPISISPISLTSHPMTTHDHDSPANTAFIVGKMAYQQDVIGRQSSETGGSCESSGKSRYDLDGTRGLVSDRYKYKVPASAQEDSQPELLHKFLLLVLTVFFISIFKSTDRKLTQWRRPRSRQQRSQNILP